MKRYINPYHHRYPLPAGSEQGGELDVLTAKYADGVVTVVFSLSHFNTTQEALGDLIPLSQTGTFFPIAAVGTLDDDSKSFESISFCVCLLFIVKSFSRTKLS